MKSGRWQRSVQVAALVLAACGSTDEARLGDGADALEADRAAFAEESAGAAEGDRAAADHDASEPAVSRYPEVAPLAVIPVATEPYDPARTTPAPSVPRARGRRGTLAHRQPSARYREFADARSARLSDGARRAGSRLA